MKTWVKIIIGLCLFAVVTIVAAPKLLSTPLVKTRVEAQLSDVIGMPVRLNGSSSVSLRPYLGVSWNDVVIGRNAGAMPLLTMDRMDAKLTLSAALFGDARLSELTFLRPILRLVRDGQGVGNWESANGQLGQWFDGSGENVALGQLTIIDGIALKDDATSRTSRKLTGIRGEIAWPTTGSAASANVSAVWNGEPVRITARVDDPVALRDGESSGFAFTVAASPLQMSFSGDVQRPDTNDAARSAGDLAVETESPTRLREWLGLPRNAFDAVGETRVAGRLDINAGRADLTDGTVTIDQQTGNGQLNLQWRREGLPLLAGTLNFDTLALPNPIQSDQTLADLHGAPKGEGSLEIDLRVSAPAATVGTLALADVAAAVLVQDGRTTIDIAEADTPAGRVSGGIRLTAADTASDEAAGLYANLAIAGTDFSTIWPNGPIGVTGAGNTSVQVEATGTTKDAIMSSLGGTIVLDMGAGTLRGLNADGLAAASTGNSVDVGGETAFDDAHVELFLVGGKAFLREARFTGAEQELNFGGRIDLRELTLALRGEAIATNDPQAKPATIFIGGTANAPLLVPLPNRTVLPDLQTGPEDDVVESQ